MRAIQLRHDLPTPSWPQVPGEASEWNSASFDIWHAHKWHTHTPAMKPLRIVLIFNIALLTGCSHNPPLKPAGWMASFLIGPSSHIVELVCTVSSVTLIVCDQSIIYNTSSVRICRTRTHVHLFVVLHDKPRSILHELRTNRINSAQPRDGSANPRSFIPKTTPLVAVLRPSWTGS